MLGKGLESLIPPIQSQGPKDEGPQAPPAAVEDGSATEPSPRQEVKPEIPPPSWSVPASTPAPPFRKESLRRTDVQEAIFHIEVEKITPNPHQPRKNFDEEGIRELAASIREFGFLQPLVVTKVEREAPTGIDVSYELIVGERRFLAAKLLGLERVPAIVRKISVPRERLEMAIIENLQRENLNPIETARAFSRLQEEFRMTQREIAVKLGKSREVVANTVRLLDLPPYIQEALGEGRITESHGRLLLTVPNPALQKKLFDDLLGSRLTTRELKNRVRAARPEKTPEEKATIPELVLLEERLSAELGTPVSISKSGESGKITISFYSDEELNHIIERLGKEEAP